MQVKSCKNCKRLFNYFYGPELCSDCAALLQENEKAISDVNQCDESRTLATLDPKLKEEEEQYLQICHYVTMHPKASIMMIAYANNIRPTKILEWIRQERMSFSDDCKDAWFNCAVCGTKINSGTHCYHCKQKL